MSTKAQKSEKAIKTRRKPMKKGYGWRSAASSTDKKGTKRKRKKPINLLLFVSCDFHPKSKKKNICCIFCSLRSEMENYVAWNIDFFFLSSISPSSCWVFPYFLDVMKLNFPSFEDWLLCLFLLSMVHVILYI